MAAYFDTSVLIPLFFNEAGTQAARHQMVLEADVWVSHWTLAEFSSAVAFKLRSAQVTEATARAARRLFHELVVSRLTVFDVLREDYVNAAGLCESLPAPGLRTPDALHLAVAQRLGLVMVSFDQTLISACRACALVCRGGE
ncbi:MAG: type II toxin-antitoxin system VapC family toxin [Rhodoferax sp.]|uniref:type II toxin-antitoxin system VapC family toxin n=1 Tax=Rhodoferax sp. TaxID=50421 RepID=UPI0013FFBC83|nr:type II toxin-antitoxin system VapC family toxin [Rhodoferax sp.]NDP40913.1 type II toxin-antitoxin system VapC family toxin [Rhodoferax sp.]